MRYSQSHNVSANNVSHYSMSRLFSATLLALCFIFLNTTAYAATKTVVGTIPGSFSVSNSGSATYSIPIQVPKGTGGMEPTLALSYDSQSGNGLIGVGWSLSGLTIIHRCGTSLVKDGFIDDVDFDDNDQLCLDGQRLIEVGVYDNGIEYRTEIDSFARIVAYGSSKTNPDNLRVWTKAGQIIEYGFTVDSKIEAQGRTDVMTWAVNKVEDTVGNYYAVTYYEDNGTGQFYPTEINYTVNDNPNVSLTPKQSVKIEYESRPDASSTYQAGSLITTNVLIKQIHSRQFVEANNAYTNIRTYTLKYESNDSTDYQSIQRNRNPR